MTKFEDNRSPYITFLESAAPSTPASTLGFLYEKTDGVLYFKNDAGTEKSVTSTTGSTQLGANVAIPNGSYADILSFSLAAGTWIVWASMLVTGGAGQGDVVAKIWDGTTAYAAGEETTASGGGGEVQLSIVSPPIVLGSTTTIKLSAGGNQAMTAVADPLILATGIADMATTMVALRVA